MLSVVRGHLASDIPVVGVELNPYIQVKKPDGTVSSEDVFDTASESGCYLRFKWYRVQTENEKYMCSAHPSNPATLQCTCCTKLRLPLNKTFFCSPECFKASWQTHKSLHARGYHGGREGRDLKDLLEARIAAGGLNGSLDAGQLYRNYDGGYSRLPPQPEGVKQSNGETWYTVGHSRSYTPYPEDVGLSLRFECCPVDSMTDSTGTLLVLNTEKVIPAPTPIPRRMLSLRSPSGYADDSAMKNPDSFTILSYNILAELYATNEMYTYCPTWALSWPYRRQNIMNEILGYNADVVCLQEVQSNHYLKFFVPEMKKFGYEALYMKKSREIYTNNAYAIDGCATFYKTARFSVAKSYDLDFSKPSVALCDEMPFRLNERQKSRILKDNLALVVVLEDNRQNWIEGRDRKPMVCVANTHITANPEFKDVKTWQVSLLTRGLGRVVDSVHCPVIIAGDFNSVPGSAAYVLATTGRIDPSHPEWATDPCEILSAGFIHGHHLNLSSAYTAGRHLSGPGGEKQKKRLDPVHHEPLFTNYTREFIGTLDYIFYSAENLVVEGMLELVDEADLRKSTGLPSPEWPSDHIAMMVEFSFKPAHMRR